MDSQIMTMIKNAIKAVDEVPYEIELLERESLLMPSMAEYKKPNYEDLERIHFVITSLVNNGARMPEVIKYENRRLYVNWLSKHGDENREVSFIFNHNATLCCWVGNKLDGIYLEAPKQLPYDFFHEDQVYLSYCEVDVRSLQWYKLVNTDISLWESISGLSGYNEEVKTVKNGKIIVNEVFKDTLSKNSKMKFENYRLMANWSTEFIDTLHEYGFATPIVTLSLNKSKRKIRSIIFSWNDKADAKYHDSIIELKTNGKFTAKSDFRESSTTLQFYMSDLMGIVDYLNDLSRVDKLLK